VNRTNAKDLEGRIDQNVTVYYQNNKPYTGVVYEMFQGRIDLEYEVVNGVKQGIETEFYPNGRIQSVSQYAGNLLDGPLISYYENGAVEEKAMFEKGVCIRSTSYDENGQVTEEYTISEDSPEYPWLTYLRQKDNA
jgi:antitoxin component YwqK of YwqJK toxin-antitoxin module